ncbi:Outer membrane protein MIP precursor [Crateriforma conspicua]|uniref:Peptidyl-prolyl cis-trans isomerase n=2 Tax=Crateriforma conspicua TaxID=2527996 RepID=A0A5C5YCI7_9PLAN|nr:Outer membrane protein MIP precursor [Crateriforma conspicua]TWT72065.1 Outer membrane protein MIP precursor [Crateriforma conspicua]
MSLSTSLRHGLAIGSLALSLGIAAMSQTAMSQETPDAKSDPIAYFLGLDIGGSMAQQGFEAKDFDIDVFAQGLLDALAKKDPQLTEEQLREAQGKLQAMMQKRVQDRAAMNKEKGEAYMEKNAKSEGVRKLDGGVQIKTTKAGEGASPSVSDRVTVHYTGKLIDGTVFDSSVQRGEPITFELGRVIKGWQIALQKMKVGEKAIVTIPSDLAYGPRGQGPVIGPNEVLIFEVELIEIP